MGDIDYLLAWAYPGVSHSYVSFPHATLQCSKNKYTGVLPSNILKKNLLLLIQYQIDLEYACIYRYTFLILTFLERLPLLNQRL